MELNIISLIYEFLKEEREKHVREDGVLWVTDLVSCRLKEKYSREYPEIDLSTLFKPPLIQGTLVHRGLETFLKEHLSSDEVKVDVEVEGFKEIDLSKLTMKSDLSKVIIKGRIDVIVSTKESKIGIEIKTARADLGIPHPHHIDQVRIYNWLFNLDKSILIYITPDRLAQYEVCERFSESEIAKRVVDDASPRYEWECQYCPFSVLCSKKVTKRR